MTWLDAVTLVVNATAILGAGLLAARIMDRASAAIRHVILSTAFGALLVMPLLMLAAPPASSPLLTIRQARPASVPNATTPRLQGHDSATASSLSTASTAGPDAHLGITPWTERVWLLWPAGSVMCITPLLLGLWRQRRLRLSALPAPALTAAARSLAADAGLGRPTEVLLHEQVQSPMTFGLLRPVIVMPMDARDWTDADLRRVLVHELEHVRRGDIATRTVVWAISAAWWFHPLAWAARRRLHLEAERACDDAVVMREDSMDYVEQLVALAERLSARGTQPALGIAQRTDLSRRVTALLDACQRRGRAGLGTTIVTGVAALITVVTIAPLRAVGYEVNNIGAGMIAETPEQNRRQRGLDRDLLEAAEAGDLVDVSELIGAGANVNAALDGDGSPLIAAARKGRVAAVRLLLDRGADPNFGVEGDGSPLIAASAQGKLDIVALLLERGARVNQVVDGDENALIQASGEGHLPVVQLLVRHGADVNAGVRVINHRDEEELRTPLGQAQRGRHDAVVAFLLRSGAR